MIPADALKGAQFTAIIVPRDMNALISFGLKTTLDNIIGGYEGDKVTINVKRYPAWKDPANRYNYGEWVEIPTCDVNFNNDFINPPGQLSDNIVSTEMTGKVVRLLEGDQICLSLARECYGGPTIPIMNIVGQTSLSIVELSGGNDGPSGPQGPTGPQAPIAPGNAIRLSLNLSGTSVILGNNRPGNQGNATIDNEQRVPIGFGVNGSPFQNGIQQSFTSGQFDVIKYSVINFPTSGPTPGFIWEPLFSGTAQILNPQQNDPADTNRYYIEITEAMRIKVTYTTTFRGGFNNQCEYTLFVGLYKWNNSGTFVAGSGDFLENSDVCANLSRSNGNSNNSNNNTNTQANMKSTCTGSYILDVVPGDRIQTKCMATKAYQSKVQEETL